VIPPKYPRRPRSQRYFPSEIPTLGEDFPPAGDDDYEDSAPESHREKPIIIWVFPKIEVPRKIIYFNRVFHYKPSILGYPYFWKHPSVFCIIFGVSLGGCGLRERNGVFFESGLHRFSETALVEGWSVYLMKPNQKDLGKS